MGMAILSPNSLNIKMEPNQEVRFSGDFQESTIECLTLRNPGRIPLLFKACLQNQLNEDCFKKDFWAMVPLNEKFEKKIVCTFDYIDNEIVEDEVNQELVKKIVFG